MSRIRTAAMLLALLLGQWLNIAHGFVHPVDSTPDTQCELCLHAQGMDSGAVASAAPPALPVLAHETIAETLAAAFNSAALRHQPIRGPPSLSI